MRFIIANCSFLIIITILCTVSWAQDNMAHIPAGEYEMGDHFPFDRPGWPITSGQLFTLYISMPSGWTNTR